MLTILAIGIVFLLVFLDAPERWYWTGLGVGCFVTALLGITKYALIAVRYIAYHPESLSIIYSWL